MAERDDQVRLIGRAGELATLENLLDTAAAGRAAGAMVSGPAGVGKTRLVSELTATARARGHIVLTGQCAELGESVPYLPLTDALWSVSRDPATPASVREAIESRPVLNRLLPGGDAGEETGGDAEVTRQRMFGTVLSLLGELADDRPVLLVFEDLHWADRSTRDLLTFLSRMLERERLLLVGTYRSDDLHRRHPLRPVIADLLRAPGVFGVEVRPLTRIEMAEYLTSLSAGRPAAELLESVIKRAEGNPFYAGELFSQAADAELPDALADLLLARIERLSEPAQQVARVAAVAGHPLDDDLVYGVSGLGQSEYDEAMRELVSHQILLAGGQASYRFRHALLREAIYGDLLPGERTRLHAAFAGLLADAPPGRRPHSAAELAYHHLASHNLSAALSASVAAGREAERLGAPADAFRHFDQALELWDVVPESAELAGGDRITLELRTAAAAAHSGESARAVSRLRRLSNSAEDIDPVVRAQVLERLAHHMTDLDAESESLKISGEALALLPPDAPPSLRARILATRARSMLWVEEVGPEELRQVAEEAIETARAAEALGAEASALVTLGLRLEAAGEIEKSRELFASARETADRANDVSEALRTAFHVARADFEHGKLETAVVRADEGVRFAVDLGLAWAPYGVSLRFLQYLIHYTTGAWDRAAALADSFGIVVGTAAEATVSAYALFIEVARGDPIRDRLQWLEPHWGSDTLVAYIARGLAAEQVLWEGGEGAEETAVGHITAALKATDPGDPALIRIAATGLEAQGRQVALARATGDNATQKRVVAAADDLIERARWSAANNPTGQRAWLGPEGRGWLARAEAEWHRVHGDDEPEMWQRVIETFGEAYVYEIARSRWRLAESLLEHGRRDAAESEWRQASEVAEQLDAAPLRRALTALGKRARFDVTTAEPARSSALAGLTSREREVLRLVAAGQSNREIATSLFISPKTASVHLSNILTKLGAGNRTQAAAIAHREGFS